MFGYKTSNIEWTALVNVFWGEMEITAEIWWIKPEFCAAITYYSENCL